MEDENLKINEIFQGLKSRLVLYFSCSFGSWPLAEFLANGSPKLLNDIKIKKEDVNGIIEFMDKTSRAKRRERLINIDVIDKKIKIKKKEKKTRKKHNNNRKGSKRKENK